MNRKKADKVAKSRALIKSERAAMRERYGYAALKEKHGKSKRPDFPDLRVKPAYATSDAVTNGFKRRSAAEHPDAIEFPVQDLHKQGPMLLTKADDMRYIGGKKS